MRRARSGAVFLSVRRSSSSQSGACAQYGPRSQHGRAQPSLSAARKPARRDRSRRRGRSCKGGPDQALRRRRGQAAGRARSPGPAIPAPGLPGGRLLRLVQRAVAAMRPAQQPDPADACEPRPHADRHPAAAGQQRRARGAAARHPGSARAERLRPAIPSIRHRRAGWLFRQPIRRRGRRARSQCPARGHLPDAVRENLRRLLLPDFLLHGAGQVRGRRTALPAHVPGHRGDPLQPPQPRRRCLPRDVGERQGLLGSAHRVQLSQTVQCRLQLSATRPTLGRSPAARG